MTPEQKIEEAAKDFYWLRDETDYRTGGKIQTIIEENKYRECKREGFIQGAKSEAAKEYHLSNLIKLEQELTRQFDSDVRVGLALLEEIRKIKIT